MQFDFKYIHKVNFSPDAFKYESNYFIYLIKTIYNINQ